MWIAERIWVEIGKRSRLLEAFYTCQDFLNTVHFVDMEEEVELTMEVLNSNQIECDCVI